jgi:hypothetical protein
MYTIRNTTGIEGMGYRCEAAMGKANLDTNAGWGDGMIAG